MWRSCASYIPPSDAPRGSHTICVILCLHLCALQVACVKMPPLVAEEPPSAACHYVPGSKNLPKFNTYSKEELEVALSRLTAAGST
jgi:hypothetical protein